jgi:predicted dehydrogenase
VRAAIVGTGFIARVHAATLRQLGVEIVALCGRTREGAEQLAVELGGGTAYDDLDDLLRAQQPDVLHICTPNALHAEQALAAFEAGAHVICEKPLAVSTQESVRMVEAAESAGRVGATCYHVRGYPLVEQMRAEVAAGSLGELRLVHGRYFCDDALRPGAGWRLRAESSGPSYVVGDLGTHWLDLAEHVAGRLITSVLAEFRTYDHERTTLEDYADLLLRFEGGASGSVLLSALAAGRKNQLLFECEGTSAGLSWDQERPDALLRRPADGDVQLVVKDPDSNAPSARPLARFPAGHAEGYGGAFRNILGNAYRAIAGEAHEPFPTFADGHRGVALLEAAVASARDGGWVEPPA